jgi:hypothetical protein
VRSGDYSFDAPGDVRAQGGIYATGLRPIPVLPARGIFGGPPAQADQPASRCGTAMGHYPGGWMGGVITVEKDFYGVKVKFDGHLHLYFRPEQFRGLQSWVKPTLCIEITLENGVILCEYDDFEKFTTILDGLEKVLA